MVPGQGLPTGALFLPSPSDHVAVRRCPACRSAPSLAAVSDDSGPVPLPTGNPYKTRNSRIRSNCPSLTPARGGLVHSVPFRHTRSQRRSWCHDAALLSASLACAVLNFFACLAAAMSGPSGGNVRSHFFFRFKAPTRSALPSELHAGHRNVWYGPRSSARRENLSP